MRACEGLRVVEIAEGTGGAVLCGQIFAGLGADVVKLEISAGDPLRDHKPATPQGISLAFHTVNAAKRSRVLAVDDATAAQDVLRDADVILVDIEHRPAFSWLDALLNDETGAVVCHVSTFGRSGARAGWRGTPMVAEAMGGLMACTGHPERPPVVSGVPYSDHVTAMFAFGGIMAALQERDVSGVGQTLDIATVDCLIALLGNFIPSYFLSGEAPKRIGNRHTIAAPWNLYPCADGQIVICTGTGGASWWKIVCGVIGRQELANDDRYDTEAKRVRNVDDVDAIVSEWTRRHPMADAVARMTAEGIPASEIATVEQILADQHYTSTRAMMRPVEADGTRLIVPGLPLKVGAWEALPQGAPRLGEGVAPSGPSRTDRKKSAGQDTHPALDGLRILEFASRTSVPMAGKIFSDLGADVIKIEPPKGESLRSAGQPIGGSSYLFQINNTGKRSLVIDPKTPRGRELILEAVKSADVFMENLAPGALEKLGLSFEDLRAANPGIIYCSVSGFGHASRYGKKKALDTVVQAASGVMYLTGYPDYDPVKLGISAVDLACATGVVGAVIAAVRRKRLTGEGGHIDLAMSDIGAWMTQLRWPEVASSHPSRIGNRGTTMCPHNLFATADGFLAIAVENDVQWEKLARVVDASILLKPELATLQHRRDNEDVIEQLIAEWARSRSAAETAAMLQQQGVPAAPLRSLPEIAEDVETRSRGMVTTVDHPLAGPLRVLGSPLKLSRTPGRVSRHAPILGEHTREILLSLGVTAEEIERLQQTNVIAFSREDRVQQPQAAAQ